MGQLDLAFVVLEHEGLAPLQHPERTAGKTRCVLAALDAVSARLHSVHLHGRIVEELVEQAHCVRTAAHAGDQGVGQPALQLHDLLFCFPADDGLEIPHHHRERMGAVDRAEHIVGVRNVRDPVAHGLVDGVLERPAPRIHRANGRSEELHAKDVQGLARHVVGSHVDFAIETEHGRGGCRRNAVLAGAGLRDDAGLAHAFRQQHLGKGIVDLVGAGMVQVFPFEVYFCAAQMVGQSFCERQRGGPSDEILVVIFKFGLELLVLLRSADRRLRARSSAGIRVSGANLPP